MANKNPSPDTRFGAKNANPGNPGGKTPEQRRNEMEAARLAAEIRCKMLSAMTESIDAGADILEMIDPATLKLFKDSEDRAHGTPTQMVGGDPESPVVHKIVRSIVKPDNPDG